MYRFLALTVYPSVYNIALIPIPFGSRVKLPAVISPVNLHPAGVSPGHPSSKNPALPKLVPGIFVTCDLNEKSKLPKTLVHVAPRFTKEPLRNIVLFPLKPSSLMTEVPSPVVNILPLLSILTLLVIVVVIPLPCVRNLKEFPVFGFDSLPVPLRYTCALLEGKIPATSEIIRSLPTSIREEFEVNSPEVMIKSFLILRE